MKNTTATVLEQNPSKQGLKQAKKQQELAMIDIVLEQNPSKQGLKRFRRKEQRKAKQVLEQNPSKQGLKLRIKVFECALL